MVVPFRWERMAGGTKSGVRAKKVAARGFVFLFLLIRLLYCTLSKTASPSLWILFSSYLSLT